MEPVTKNTILNVILGFILVTASVAGGAFMGAMDRMNLRMQVEVLQEQISIMHDHNELVRRLDLCLNDGEVDE